MASTSSGLSFDDALSKYLGGFGYHQKKVLILTSLLWIPNALFILLMVFASKDPVKAHWWRCNDAADVACTAVYNMADPGIHLCDIPRSSWEWTAKSNSVVSQFDLICKRSVLSQLANSGFFAGYLVGSGVFGTLADARGRKLTLCCALAVGIAFTLMASFSVSYWMYFAARLLTGVGAAGMALVTYLLATESIGAAWRGSAGVGTQMVFIVGEFVLVLVAYLLQNWHYMCLCCMAIGVCGCAVLPFVPESPRWLLAKGRRKEAEAIMQRIADDNGTRMPLEPLAEATPGPAVGSPGRPQAPGQNAGQMSLVAVLRDRHICRRFFILAYVWCILCMTYYGISLALNGLPCSIYVTFVITAAAEFPSNLLGAWLIERIGRHNSLAAGILVGGVSCLACSFCPPGMGQAALAAVSKFGCAGAFTIASIYTSELFPTLVRSAVLGAENEAARVGGIAAPFIVLLGQQTGNSSMPFLIFGCTSVVAGLLIFTLPETLGAPMPDTMKDMDAIQSIFSTGAWKQGWKATRTGLFSTRAHGSTLDLHKLSTVMEEGRGDSNTSMLPHHHLHQAPPPPPPTLMEIKKAAAAAASAEPAPVPGSSIGTEVMQVHMWGSAAGLQQPPAPPAPSTVADDSSSEASSRPPSPPLSVVEHTALLQAGRKQ